MIIILVIVSVVALGNLLFIVCAPYLVKFLTAGRYVGSVPFVQILALSNIVMACYYMIVKLLIGYGYVKAELGVPEESKSGDILTFTYTTGKSSIRCQNIRCAVSICHF